MGSVAISVFGRTPIDATQLINEIRLRADMQNTQFVTDTEILSYAVQSAYELYDFVIAEHEDYILSSFLYTVPPGSNLIPLTTVSDFAKFRGLDINLGGQFYTVHSFDWKDRNYYVAQNIALQLGGYVATRYRLQGNNLYLVPTDNAQNYQYRVWYTPQVPPLVLGTAASGTIQDISYTSQVAAAASNNINISYVGGAQAGDEQASVASDGVSITVQIQGGVSTAAQVAGAINNTQATNQLVLAAITGVSSNAEVTTGAVFLQGGTDDSEWVLPGFGWEEYIIVDGAIKCLRKEESDTTMLQQDKQFQLTRIRSALANRDDNEPIRISRVRRRWGYGYGMGWGGMGYGGGPDGGAW